MDKAPEISGQYLKRIADNIAGITQKEATGKRDAYYLALKVNETTLDEGTRRGLRTKASREQNVILTDPEGKHNETSWDDSPSTDEDTQIYYAMPEGFIEGKFYQFRPTQGHSVTVSPIDISQLPQRVVEKFRALGNKDN